MLQVGYGVMVNCLILIVAFGFSHCGGFGGGGTVVCMVEWK
jgi:hypothetical protein